MIGRDLKRHAAYLLDLAANNGLAVEEVGDPNAAAVALARKARDAVLRAGCSSAVKLEAAAMLRDGWEPRRKLRLLPAPLRLGAARQCCAICTRDVSGRPIRLEELGRGGAEVVVCAGWGCDRTSREGNHSFGLGDWSGWQVVDVGGWMPGV